MFSIWKKKSVRCMGAIDPHRDTSLVREIMPVKHCPVGPHHLRWAVRKVGFLLPTYFFLPTFLPHLPLNLYYLLGPWFFFFIFLPHLLPHLFLQLYLVIPIGSIVYPTFFQGRKEVERAWTNDLTKNADKDTSHRKN